MEPIDIVIPYVNFNDSHWQYYYHLYKPNSGPGTRFRETNTLKYELRSIEKNLPWINNVYLILAFETQIPKWLNPKAKNLKIVYHKDYIPSINLPTFNSSVINIFLNRIESLSKNFIISNDDIIFTKENPSSWYFEGSRPVMKIKVLDEDFKLRKQNLFDKLKYNNVKLFNEIVQSGKMIKYTDWHLALPHSKDLWNEIWNQYSDILTAGFKLSKFRKSYNYNTWLFAYIAMYTGLAIDNQSLDTSGYYGVSDNSSYDEIYKKIHNHPVVCLNDCIEKNTCIWDTVSEILEEVFPEKSKFEL